MCGRGTVGENLWGTRLAHAVRANDGLWGLSQELGGARRGRCAFLIAVESEEEERRRLGKSLMSLVSDIFDFR